MKNLFPIILVLPSIMAQAAEITLHALDIPEGDYSTNPFVTSDSKVSITESTGTWSTGGTSPASFGGAEGGSNSNAFDQTDEGNLTLQFDANSGLRTFSTIWTTATITISGFLADPDVSPSGGAGATASYADGTVTLTQPWNADTIISYNFAWPTASAGQTLTFTFSPQPNAPNTNYQAAFNSIIYEDSIPPNPTGFAIAFDATAGFAGTTDIPFTAGVISGVPEVAQNNWNRTSNIDNPIAEVTGGVAEIATPLAGLLVDSMGNQIGDGTTGVGFTYTAGAGAFSYMSNGATPFGSLFNTFLYGNAASPDTSISLTNIPYTSYDVYVYFGADTNQRRGTITSSTAGETYSFVTASQPRVATGVGVNYVRTTDTDLTYPSANYARFESQNSPSFDVTTTWGDGGGNLGIMGIQVVETSANTAFQLTDPTLANGTFNASLNTSFSGTFILERSPDLNDPWTPIGDPFTHAGGITNVVDDAPLAGRAFYRVRIQE